MTDFNQDLRRQLLTAIREDPHREPMEKETGLLWSKDSDEVHVNTAEAGLMRRLVRHPEFTLRRVELAAEGGRNVRGVHADDLQDGLEGRAVYSIIGTLPVGCIAVTGQPRASGGHAQVVSTSKLLDIGGGDS